MFTSPFSNLTQQIEKKLTYYLLTLLVFCIVVLRYLDHFLINTVCKGGILDFEFVKDVTTAQLYLNSWDSTAKIAAGLSLGFDFLFPIVYTSFLALLVHKLNVRLWKNRPFFKLGNVIIWSLFLAAIFDFIENLGLIMLLLGDVRQLWASVAYCFASMKFLIIFASFGYILINFGVFLIKKSKK